MASIDAIITAQKNSGFLPSDPRKKVVIALSGGVDSSASAAILKIAGYAVEAIFMKNWEEDDRSSDCSALNDLNDAQAVCTHLNIPLHRINFSAEYWTSVFEHFLSELRALRTPNPDILCNKWIKFDACLKYVRQVLKADYLATGHYAQILSLENQFFLLKGRDETKDQSYFLHTLSQEQLSQSLFPVGGLEKSSVRAIARECGLPTAEKKDSTGICFIGPKNFSKFLGQYLQSNPGPIVDLDGNNVGEHSGLAHYTIGQRKGLQLAQKAEFSGQAWYVVDKDSEKNALIVTKDVTDPKLFATEFVTEAPHWINGVPKLLLDNQNMLCQTKIRYRQECANCTICFDQSGGLRVFLEHPLRACTPGQSAVFYVENRVLGGAIISAVQRNS